MTPRGFRDHALGALILALFASAWFGWSQAHPPSGWSLVLAIGSVVSILVAIPGGFLAWKARGDQHSALDPRNGQKLYGIIFGAEIVIIVVGNIVLSAFGRPEWIPVWTCFVVGVHMFPLAVIFHAPIYRFTGALLVGVAATALVTLERTTVDGSFVTGIGGGIALILTAMSDLTNAARMSRSI